MMMPPLVLICIQLLPVLRQPENPAVAPPRQVVEAPIPTAAPSNANAKVGAVCTYVWGKAPPSSAGKPELWTVVDLPLESAAAEVPLLGDRKKIALVTGKDQEFRCRTRAGLEMVTRSVIAYVDTESNAVLKLLIVDESKDWKNPMVLEPLAADYVNDLPSEQWLRPAMPDGKCVIDALEGVFSWGLGASTLANASRVVVHSVVCRQLSISGQPGAEKSLWSVDFRDGAVSPKALPDGSAVTQLRYSLDLASCKPLGAENQPAFRGAREIARALDEERLKQALPATSDQWGFPAPFTPVTVPNYVQSPAAPSEVRDAKIREQRAKKHAPRGVLVFPASKR
jgi:hypothetical protein